MKQEEIMPLAVPYGPRENQWISQKEKTKQHVVSLVEMWMDANELAYESRRDVQTRKPAYGYQRGKAGWEG